MFLILSNKKFQKAVGFLPVVLAVIYLVVFLMDLANASSIIVVNDKTLGNIQNSSTIHKVSSFKEYNGKNIIGVDGDKSYDIEAKRGSTLYTVSVGGEGWYNVDVEDGGSADLDTLSYVTKEDYQTGVLTVSYKDIKYKVKLGEPVYKVSLANDDAYKVTLMDKARTSFVVDSDASLEFKKEEYGIYKFKYTNSFIKEFSKLNINYCTTLPTDDLYFDSIRNQVVMNVSSDFSKNFLLGTKWVLVMFSMVLYVSALIIIKVFKKPLGFNSWAVLISNGVCLFLLALLGLLTLVMFTVK